MTNERPHIKQAVITIENTFGRANNICTIRNRTAFNTGMNIPLNDGIQFASRSPTGLLNIRTLQALMLRLIDKLYFGFNS
jgi:hypothetical protein